ncbi:MULTISPECIES: hypothetical protein [unclassified Synechococcus]|uniref:hypothetical protein n=1 Tax=unclassified Synechococcus TaxID=2626047 RepID=UPI002000DCE2|nr:hypothetical protein [Synechococcus sp. A10-1-5-1]UPM49903.1 hypothetical protein MY494_11370 [Synechococcus sp. A10-1-5-1]
MTNSTPTLALLIPQYIKYLHHLDSAHMLEQEIKLSLNASGLTWNDLEEAAANAEQSKEIL